MGTKQIKYVLLLCIIFVALIISACTGSLESTKAVKDVTGAVPLLAKSLPQTEAQQPTENIAADSTVEESLSVTASQPSDGAVDVEPTTPIVVFFDQPIVPLTTIDEQHQLPQPITIEPSIEGNGEWISTSVYTFQPDEMLAGASEYFVTVEDVSAMSGLSLEEPYTFSFTTTSPIVTDVSPTGPQVAPDATIEVEFSQAMDPETTEAAFRLSGSEAGDTDAISGSSSWDSAGQTFYFTPTSPLEFGKEYLVFVNEEAMAAGKTGSLREPFASNFSVAPYPDIVRTSPLDGATDVLPEANVSIQFNTPMSPTQVLENVSVTPILSTTSVYSYYSTYDNELSLSWFGQPDTTYTVTVGGEIEDEFENQLGEDRVLSFTTGDYAPFVNLELERFTHFSASDEPRVTMLYRNLDEVTVDLYRLPESEILKLAGPDQWEAWNQYAIPNPDTNLVWSRQYDTSGERNVTIRQIVTLTQASGDLLPPGAYFIDVVAPQEAVRNEGRLSEQAAVILSNANLLLKKSSSGDSLAWLTDLVTGQPIADAPVRLVVDSSSVGEAITDDDGLVSLRLDTDTKDNWNPLIAFSGSEGSANYSVASTDWSSGIAAWDFDLYQGFSADRLASHFYTERPIYKPGDTVYWKGIVRAIEDDTYTIPSPSLPIMVTIRDDRGNVIYEGEPQLNDIGTVDGELALSNEAISGYYFIEVEIGYEGSPKIYTGVGFQVASYRKPEFEITVSTEQDEYVQGETIVIETVASYFSSGPLANAPVTWQLFVDPYEFMWMNEEGRRYSFAPYDPDSEVYDPYQNLYTQGLITEGTGTTDEEGRFVLEMPADISHSLASQRWVYNVTVQSPTNQFVSAGGSVPVHRANFYVGLSPNQYVVSVEEEAEVDVVTVSTEREVYPGAEVDVKVLEYTWNSVYERAADGSYRWEADVERVPVYTTTLTTDRSGAATLQWTPEQPGQYQVVASGMDEEGNRTSSTVFIWVSSPEEAEFVAWPMKNNDRIDIVADRDSYAPGDVAQILVPSPFQGEVKALVTTERAGVLSSEVIQLSGNSHMIDLPITEQHLPNVYVSVTLIKGVDETNPVPAMRVGYVNLPVDTSYVELDVLAEPSNARVEPGETVTYTLTVRDNSDEPVEGAEVSVAMVDKAVLSLSSATEGTLLNAFYQEQPLSIRTGATLIINEDRLSQQLSEGAKGGGGGGGGGAIDLRTDFSDVAFWQADLVSDENGQIVISVELPDSLTSWQLVAKAVTVDTKVGETTDEVVATKTLQIRPLTPRFVTAGDRPWLGAQIINTSDITLSGTLTYTIEGAEFTASQDDLHEHTIQYELDAGEQTTSVWPAEVVAPAEVVSITATTRAVPVSEKDEADEEVEYTDGLSLSLPVNRYTSPETVATSGVVQSEELTEYIVLSDNILANNEPDEGSLQVRVEPNLASGIIPGLDYLQHYPYECNEQVVSRFLPNLVTARALGVLDVENSELTTQLAYQLGVGSQKLAMRQNFDGGWGYWPNQESSPFITAYVLWGISLAEQQGYALPDNTTQAAVDYLDSQFVAPSATDASWKLNEMAFVHYVLSELGEGDAGRASTLYDVRENLDIYGKALLAMALHNMDESADSDPRVQTLLDDIVGSAVLTATGANWEEQGTDFWTMNTDTRSTSIALTALVRLRPEQPLLPQAVRWLMSTREAGRWSTTQENAWAIIGLTEWMTLSDELQGAYDWTVMLNDDEIGSGSVKANSVNLPVELVEPIGELLRNEVNELTFSRSNESGSLYYSTHLQYYLDASAIDARDSGIVIDRKVTNMSGDSVNSVAIGDVVSVTVTIIAPTDLYHLLVETPLPAGLEPIDPNLATTSRQFDGPQVTYLEDEGSTGWWRNWIPTDTDYRDDMVALFGTYLPAGAYEYTFNARASTRGEYRVLPAYGEMMYFPEVWGRSSGALFTVTE